MNSTQLLGVWIVIAVLIVVVALLVYRQRQIDLKEEQKEESA